MIRIVLGALATLSIVMGVGTNTSTVGGHLSERVEQVRDHALAASRRIVCDIQSEEGKVETYGTGFFIAHNRMVTAAHVIDEGVCFIEGVGAARVVEINPSLDFAIIEPVILTPDLIEPAQLQTSCRALPTSQFAYSTGFARGQEFTILRGRWTEGAGPTDHLSILSIRGMSGGPVIDDETDRVVGWVSSIEGDRGLTNFGEIRMTSLCR